jgi:predicted anti-sigma-YlaC factor YlaD
MTIGNAHAAFRKLAATADDFDLAPGERRELDAHVTACAECRRFMAALAGDRARLRNRRRDVPRPRLQEAVLAIDGPGALARPALRMGLSWAAVAVTLLTLALLASLTFVGMRLLLRTPVTDTVQPAPAAPLGDLPLLGRISATIPVPIGGAAAGHECHVIQGSDCLTAVVASSEAVWVSTTEGIVRIDPANSRVVASIPTGAFPRAIAVAGDRVWVALGGDRSIVSVDATENRIAGSIPLDDVPTAIAIDAQGVWVTAGDQLLRIDGATLAIERRIQLPAAANSVAAVAGVLVLALPGADAIAFVDEATDVVTLAPTGRFAEPWQIRAVGTDVWFAGHDLVGRIDPLSRSITETITALNLPDLAIEPRTDGTAPRLWLASALNRGVEALDPALGRAVSGLSIDAAGNWRASIAVADGTVWVRLYDPAVTLRITPLPPGT